MNLFSRPKHHAIAGAAALLLASPLLVAAQAVAPPANGTLRPTPRPSETSAIPGGVNAGTPATSNSVPLGTPTMPANAAEQEEMKRASAAARAAARKRAPAASTPASAASAVVLKGDAAASAAAARP